MQSRVAYVRKQVMQHATADVKAVLEMKELGFADITRSKFWTARDYELEEAETGFRTGQNYNDETQTYLRYGNHTFNNDANQLAIHYKAEQNTSARLTTMSNPAKNIETDPLNNNGTFDISIGNNEKLVIEFKVNYNRNGNDHVWPAVWMMGANHGWPSNCEIDMFEVKYTFTNAHGLSIVAAHLNTNADSNSPYSHAAYTAQDNWGLKKFDTYSGFGDASSNISGVYDQSQYRHVKLEITRYSEELKHNNSVNVYTKDQSSDVWVQSGTGFRYTSDGNGGAWDNDEFWYRYALTDLGEIDRNTIDYNARKQYFLLANIATQQPSGNGNYDAFLHLKDVRVSWGTVVL